MEKPLFKKSETLILVLFSLILICLMLIPRFLPSSEQAVAVVTYNGNTVAEIPLERSGTYTIEGDLTATLVVENGKIRFVDSQCPDRICEAFGWIGNPGESAICAPARLAVQIIGG